ncbi:efflux RND transporter periplasmic adaptor subunit [Brevibacillus humidisoli]|uniref:efflux RND transporter periplasmic adaptor subunit n=1 Tax=Brevibacillus humidisoli TaxID=2895522 RepID=UPI001E3A09CF|nr:efflux RND transporter periplasmic adaptor subunit [Brevibacillus humidisoli]UFJ40856.1 efflux RND transporter periplasmic adaptor subunit [Brevibacillus humidisoli]
MEKKPFHVAAALLSMLLFITGCSAANETAARMQRSNQQSVPVEVSTAALEPFAETSTFSGRLEANQEVTVTPKASGRIEQILVKVGESVKAGQIIARLDEEDLKLELQKAEEALALANARYEEGKSTTRPESLAQMQNSVAEAKAKYEAAQKNFERNQTLYEEGAVSQQVVEEAEMQMISAKTSYENLQQSLEMEQSGPTESSLKVLEIQLTQARTDYTIAQSNYDNAAIAAPIDGVIAELPVSVGESIGTSSAIATITDISTMKVVTSVSESQVGTIAVGQTFQVDVSSIGYQTDGNVISVSPKADDSKMYPIEISISDPEGKAKVGMLASLELHKNQRNAIVVPSEAIVTKDNKTYLYVVENNTANQVEVTTGESDGERTEITSGLTAGQQIVVKGQNTLYPGSAVTIMNQGNAIDTNPNDTENTSQDQGKTKIQQGSDSQRGSGTRDPQGGRTNSAN